MTTSKSNKYQSARDISERLGVHKTTITRIAAKHNIGKIVGQQRIFTKKDAEKIQCFCRFSVGNPNFGRNN